MNIDLFYRNHFFSNVCDTIIDRNSRIILRKSEERNYCDEKEIGF